MAEDSVTLARNDGFAPLPIPVSNNAVASVKVGRREYVVSFNGLGEGRTHADTLASTYVYDSRSRSWSSKNLAFETSTAVPSKTLSPSSSSCVKVSLIRTQTGL